LCAKNQAIRYNAYGEYPVSIPLLSFALFKNGIRAVFEHGVFRCAQNPTLGRQPSVCGEGGVVSTSSR
jgi:hypothetical protein